MTNEQGYAVGNLAYTATSAFDQSGKEINTKNARTVLELRAAKPDLLTTSSCEMWPMLKTNHSRYDHGYDFVNQRHPQDYQLLDSPIEPEYIVRDLKLPVRLILRVPWKVGDKFIPMSFILETGEVGAFFFSAEAFHLLTKYKRIEDYQHCTHAIWVHFGGCEPKSSIFLNVARSHVINERGNFIGLVGLKMLGFSLGETKSVFSFRYNFSWF
jgi:hypothetical protein